MASLIRFAWAGYMLEIKLPPGVSRPHKWKVQFRGDAAKPTGKRIFIILPGSLHAIRKMFHSKNKAPKRALLKT